MRNENVPDIYAEEQMPPRIQEKIAILESAGQAALIPEAQRELRERIERAFDAREISAGTRAYLNAHYLN